MTPTCPLCGNDAGITLWRDALCRVALVDEPGYPGFLRVILNAHVKEMTDLPAAEQTALLRVVLASESALREVMAPDKINLASLGNVVPHLHWHVIARFTGDPHFPNSVWGERRRNDAPVAPGEDLTARLADALNRRLALAPEPE
ncbi:MAG TPA: HIT family protein [Thiobacillaceae bacterium]|nr:HIT family protein [Thiobacillaceae bacterium]